MPCVCTHAWGQRPRYLLGSLGRLGCFARHPSVHPATLRTYCEECIIHTKSLRRDTQGSFLACHVTYQCSASQHCSPVPWANCLMLCCVHAQVLSVVSVCGMGGSRVYVFAHTCLVERTFSLAVWPSCIQMRACSCSSSCITSPQLHWCILSVCVSVCQSISLSVSSSVSGVVCKPAHLVDVYAS